MLHRRRRHSIAERNTFPKRPDGHLTSFETFGLLYLVVVHDVVVVGNFKTELIHHMICSFQDIKTSYICYFTGCLFNQV